MFNKMTNGRKLGSGAEYIYFIALFWLLVGFILTPMFHTLIKSMETGHTYGFENYISYLGNPANLQVVGNTIFLGLMTVLVCGVVGSTLAFYMHFIDMRFKKLLHILFLGPMMLPGVIIVIASIQLYGESGIITKSIQWLLGMETPPFILNGFWGILFIHTYTQYVYFYLNVSIALKYFDHSMIDAARSLGAGRVKTFTSVILPALKPAIYSSAIMTFISGIGSFSAPVLIGGRFRVLSIQILLSKANNYMNLASTQVLILMGIGIVAMMIGRRYERKSVIASSVKATPVVCVKMTNPLAGAAVSFVMLILMLAIIAPLVVVFIYSFVKSSSLMVDIIPTSFTLDNYVRLFEKKRIMDPFRNSILMSISTVAAGLMISVPLGYRAVRVGKSADRFAEILAMLPWAMPMSIIAVNLINAFNTENIFAFNQVLIGTYWILPFAYILIALPVMTRANILAFQSYSKVFEDASRGLGANAWQTFFKVTIPMVMPSILSAGALVFIRTVGEYTASALLYGVHNRPISIAMVNAMQEYDLGLSMTYGVMTLFVCMIAMAIILKMDKKKYLIK